MDDTSMVAEYKRVTRDSMVAHVVFDVWLIAGVIAVLFFTL
ncbi:hypothetical protein [Stieleria sp. JC731]|nr:hypothetical protein [Stieleria sp. JC731]